MSRRIGNNIVVLEAEPDRRCELCGKLDECRPAGPNQEQVCFDCSEKDPAARERYIQRLLEGGVRQ